MKLKFTIFSKMLADLVVQIESCTNKYFFQLKKERLIDTEEEELETTTE